MELNRDDWRRLGVGIAWLCGGMVALLVAIRLLSLPRSDRGYRRQPSARTQIQNFGSALAFYSEDNGRPPTSAQGLSGLIRRPTIAPLPRNWRGPYLTDTDTIPIDPWDREYVYQSPGPRGEPYVITSLGTDGRPGGDGDDADISSNQFLASRRRTQ